MVSAALRVADVTYSRSDVTYSRNRCDVFPNCRENMMWITSAFLCEAMVLLVSMSFECVPDVTYSRCSNEVFPV